MNGMEKKVVVGGREFESITAAARWIVEDSGRGKVDTIRREIRRRHMEHGDCWVMYGEYTIGY